MSAPELDPADVALARANVATRATLGDTWTTYVVEVGEYGSQRAVWTETVHGDYGGTDNAAFLLAEREMAIVAVRYKRAARAATPALADSLASRAAAGALVQHRRNGVYESRVIVGGVTIGTGLQTEYAERITRDLRRAVAAALDARVVTEIDACVAAVRAYRAELSAEVPPEKWTPEGDRTPERWAMTEACDMIESLLRARVAK